jgi:SAM-dependent methyltransferase
MSQLVFDEDLAQQMEVVYRSRDVLRRRRLVYQALGARPGERILDVGCGPGFYVSELLDQVGPEGSVVGVDASPQMLAVAAHRSEGRPNVAFQQSDATSLPVEDAGFDRAISVQVTGPRSPGTRATRAAWSAPCAPGTGTSPTRPSPEPSPPGCAPPASRT